MITAFCPSPSLDVTYVVDRYALGAIHRPVEVHRMAGGKALNAARAAATLHGDVSAVASLGGGSGASIAAGARLAGVDLHVVETGTETRSCVSVLSLAEGRLTEVYEHPTPVAPADWRRALDLLDDLLAVRPGWLVVSGGMPAGLGAGTLGEVLDLADRRGASVALDSHGAALSDALSTRSPALVKVNRGEAAELLDLPAETDAAALASELHRRTGGLAVVTDGEHGAVGVDASGARRTDLPGRRGAYPVGSGDSFLGGLVVALDAGRDLDDALRLATACGTANALVPGAARFERVDAEALLPLVRIARL